MQAHDNTEADENETLLTKLRRRIKSKPSLYGANRDDQIISENPNMKK